MHESASGWQQVNFAAPVAISTNTTYVASYYAADSGYCSSAGYFTTSGMDNGPLHALQSGVDGPNGLYLYGADAFPTQTDNGANYWVDVVFSTSAVSDTAPLTVADQTPEPDTTAVSSGTKVTAVFSEAVNPATLIFTLTDTAGNTVPASVSYDRTTLTATLTPAAPLAGSTTYTATVSASDVLGKPMMAPESWSFTTAPGWQQTSAADFATGTLSGTVVTNTAGGEVQLAPNFAGGDLGSPWASTQWLPGGGVLPSGSSLSIAGAELRSTQTFDGVPVEASVNFAPAPYQHFGLATDLSSTVGNSWAIFSTMGTSDTLFARVNANGVTTDVNLGALPVGYHVYRVQPVAGGFQFYVDGVLQTTIAEDIPIGTGLHVVASSYRTYGPSMLLGWARQGDGTFTSSVFDAGQAVTWGAATWTATMPPGTNLIIQTRSGNSPTLDGTWSAWTTVSDGGTVSSPVGRYLQYRAIFIADYSTGLAVTPVLDNITINWS
jgi:hypothetical protein